jgi:predicted dehydrogenase
MKRVNLALIGLGYIGKVHLRHSLALSKGKLVAVADISKRALEKAKKMGVKNTYSDYRELLRREQIDAVIIALPTYLHKSCAVEVAEAGKDLFLEKPLATNVAEGKDIILAAEKHGIKLMVGYPLRFNPAFRVLKQQVQDGLLGEVQTATATYVGTGPFMHRAEGYEPRPVPSWWFDKTLTGGGALMDLGCHVINALRWYLGEIVDIRSYLGHRFNVEIEDYAACMAKFASGQISFINVGWYSLAHKVRVELLGTARYGIAESKSASRTLQAMQLVLGRPSQYYLPHYWELEHFAYCVANDVPPLPSGTDSLKDLGVISKAYFNQIQLD